MQWVPGSERHWFLRYVVGVMYRSAVFKLEGEALGC